MKPRVIFELFGLPITDTTLTGLLLSVLMVLAAAWLGRHLSRNPSTLQAAVEQLLGWIRSEIGEVVGEENADEVFPLVATLSLWILLANLCGLIPGLPGPTSDLSESAAAAFVVFLAVPWFGIRRHGLELYLESYLKPTPLMLPFNIIGELSRTLALALRLFGNMISGDLMVAVALLLAGVLVPVPLMALSLLTSVLHAYIFSILAVVYIGAAFAAHEAPSEPEELDQPDISRKETPLWRNE